MLSIDIAKILSCARTRDIAIEILGDEPFLDLSKLDSEIIKLLLMIAHYESMINDAEKRISDIVNEFDNEVKNRMYC